MRHTDNGTWWSGAVLAHPATESLASRVGDAERFYAEHGGAPAFQICANCPEGLDEALAERGYRWQAPVSLLTAAAGAPTVPHAVAGMAVRVDASMSPAWLAVLRATIEPGTDAEHETRLLPRPPRR